VPYLDVHVDNGPFLVQHQQALQEVAQTKHQVSVLEGQTLALVDKAVQKRHDEYTR
jgi:hypothetical protein